MGISSGMENVFWNALPAWLMLSMTRLTRFDAWVPTLRVRSIVSVTRSIVLLTLLHPRRRRPLPVRTAPIVLAVFLDHLLEPARRCPNSA
jgi:hypothetical protein